MIVKALLNNSNLYKPFMKQGLIIFIALGISCSPLRHLEKVVATIGPIPPIQVMGGPIVDPAANDPVHFSSYFQKALLFEIGQLGIQVSLTNAGNTVKEPTYIQMEVAGIHVQDNRPPLEPGGMSTALPGPAIQLMMMGGFNSYDKKGEPISFRDHFSYDLSHQELATLIREDPNADPVLAVLDRAAKAYALQFQEQLLAHIKENR
jgi:hypothetical protein